MIYSGITTLAVVDGDYVHTFTETHTLSGIIKTRWYEFCKTSRSVHAPKVYECEFRDSINLAEDIALVTNEEEREEIADTVVFAKLQQSKMFFYAKLRCYPTKLGDILPDDVRTVGWLLNEFLQSLDYSVRCCCTLDLRPDNIRQEHGTTIILDPYYSHIGKQ